MMMTTVSPPDLSSRPYQLAVERHIGVSPETLYKAWTECFDAWFATPGSVLVRGEVNAVFFFETRYEGERHPHYGRFLRLDADRRVELTWTTSATKGVEAVVVVELEPVGPGTHLRLTHSGFPDEESRRRHADAWPDVLAQLDERLITSDRRSPR
jgi:uncharacterized protein YndB with AHSA1/START domain